MKKQITPSDTRYIPFTQQEYCCVPTCIQMVMYRHSVPLIPAEKIGYELGLIVPPDREHLFYNVRTSKKRPPSGYGTRIYVPKYEPSAAFKRLKIPLKFEINPITQFKFPNELRKTLKEIEDRDLDVLVCFHYGTLANDSEKDYGHVCVFDRIYDQNIRIIDPSPKHPKWRNVKTEKMFKAMIAHGEKRSAGLWILELIN